MPAPGETDLGRILAGLEVHRRPGVFAHVERPPGTPAPAGAVAMVDEGESVTDVVPADDPVAAGATFRAAWLTIAVATSLDALGVTAALAHALAAAGISANVLAGARHDHVLVPVDRADEAIAALLGLRRPNG